MKWFFILTLTLAVGGYAVQPATAQQSHTNDQAGPYRQVAEQIIDEALQHPVG